jgi:hypothetical protein
VGLTSFCEIGGPERIGDEVAGIGGVFGGLLFGGTSHPRFGLLDASLQCGIREALGAAWRSRNAHI